MKVLVDTSIWSVVLRRKSPPPGQVRETLSQLVQEDRAHLIGAIRQELLSGIKDRGTFDRLAATLDAFPDLLLAGEDYVRAASFFNTCREVGIQGSNTDFLICAAAVRHDLAIYTSDRDFERFALHVPIQLYRPSSE